MDAAGLTLAIATGLAGAWSGAALFQVLITNATLREAGPAAAMGWARAHAKRRGTGRFFAALAASTTLAAFAASAWNGAFRMPWSPSGGLVALGTALAVIALARGATANREAEARYLRAVIEARDPPTAAQLMELEELSANALAVNTPTAITTTLALVAFLASWALA